MGKTIDLTGKVFGRLTVTGRGTDVHYGRAQPRKTCQCLCTCGTVVEVLPYSLTRGLTRSCGCYRKDVLSSKAEVLEGKVFDRLTVVSRVPNSSPPRWDCVCVCGGKASVSSTNLTKGRTRSCGCYRTEVCVARGKRNRKYPGLTRRQAAKKWRDENPENLLVGKHRRRADILGVPSTLTVEEWKLCLSEHKDCCAYCFEHEDVVGKMTLDHKVPMSRGGHNTLENIAPACGICNSMKGTRNAKEFYIYRTELIERGEL